MALEVGYPGVVLEGSNQIANVSRWNFREVGETEDVTVGGGAGARASAPTLTSLNGTIECFADDSDAAQGALRPGAVVTIVIQRRGAGSGLPQQTITGATITGVDWGWQPDQHNRVTFTFENGSLDDTPQT